MKNAQGHELLSAARIHPAIEKTDLKPPPWWEFNSTTNTGAWACMHSHKQVLEGVTLPTLVLEDDALPRDGYSDAELLGFVSLLPEGWLVAYVGGELIDPGTYPPVKVSECVLRCREVNRMHAYLVSAAGARVMLAALDTSEPWIQADEWGRMRFHCDHKCGRLHRVGKLPALAPHRWMFHQGPDVKSDIDGTRRRYVSAWKDPEFYLPGGHVRGG